MQHRHEHINSILTNRISHTNQEMYNRAQSLLFVLFLHFLNHFDRNTLLLRS